MAEKVRIYIDVDGVINAFTTKPAWGEPPRQDRILGYVITHHKGLIDSLNEIAENDHVEFVWLTTWQNHAVTDLAPVVGLDGPWRALTSENCRPTGYIGFQNTAYWWKLDSIIEDLHENPVDKFIWIDDELSLRRGAQDWYNLHHSEKATGLLISPHDSTGLTPDDVCGIIDYINGPQG